MVLTSAGDTSLLLNDASPSPRGSGAGGTHERHRRGLGKSQGNHCGHTRHTEVFHRRLTQASRGGAPATRQKSTRLRSKRSSSSTTSPCCPTRSQVRESMGRHGWDSAVRRRSDPVRGNLGRHRSLLGESRRTSLCAATPLAPNNRAAAPHKQYKTLHQHLRTVVNSNINSC